MKTLKILYLDFKIIPDLWLSAVFCPINNKNHSTLVRSRPILVDPAPGKDWALKGLVSHSPEEGKGRKYII